VLSVLRRKPGNLFPRVRKSRWHNFSLLKGKKINQVVALLNKFVSKSKFDFVRIHESGIFSVRLILMLGWK